MQDIRYGLRLLWKSPTYAFAAIAALAIGIGANTAVFSIVNGVLLKAFPYKDAQQLVLIYEQLPNAPAKFGVSPPDFGNLAQSARSFSGMAAYLTRNYASGDTHEHTEPLLQHEPVVVEFDPPEKLRAAQIGLMDRDVKARVADRLAREGEPACVAELGEDRDRGQMTDPVETHQRLAAWLAPGVGTQLLVHRRELGIHRAYHLERDRYLLARGGRQLEASQPLATRPGQQTDAVVVRAAVVVEHRVNPLLPLPPLVDERMAQPHARA